MSRARGLLAGLLSDPCGQWRRACVAQPRALAQVMALENALDAVMWSYSGGEGAE